MSYQMHAVELADDGPPSLTCTCSKRCEGETWQEAGKEFDEHVNEVGVNEDGEQ